MRFKITFGVVLQLDMITFKWYTDTHTKQYILILRIVNVLDYVLWIKATSIKEKWTYCHFVHSLFGFLTVPIIFTELCHDNIQKTVITFFSIFSFLMQQFPSRFRHDQELPIINLKIKSRLPLTSVRILTSGAQYTFVSWHTGASILGLSIRDPTKKTVTP